MKSIIAETGTVRCLYLNTKEDTELRVDWQPAEGVSTPVLSFNYFNEWWTRPAFLHDLSELKERTQLLLIRENSAYQAILAVPGKAAAAEFACAGSRDTLRMTFPGRRPGSEAQGAVLSARDEDPYRCIRAVVAAACEMHGIPTREKRTYPAFAEKLGWCSWDCCYQDVNQDQLIQKAQEIQEKCIPFGWLLIDDGWEEISDNKLAGLEADRTKFPDGLKACVREIKQISGVHSVGVWHTLSGYWDGIAPGSPLAESMRDILMTNKDALLLPEPGKDEAYRFFDKWHTALKESGIDFVKVDSQSSARRHYGEDTDLGACVSDLHAALDESVNTHFDGGLINCMGMGAENVFARPSSAISRNSDDFVPKRVNGFFEHMLQNVYNSIWHGEIYYTDWDMFWSSHPDAAKHAVLRALSGGPVYVSDKIGGSEKEIMERLCYSDGTILRAPQPPVPARQSLFADPGETGYLKILNTCRGAAYMAVYGFPFRNKDWENNGGADRQEAEGVFCPEEFFDGRGAEAVGRADSYALWDPAAGRGMTVSAGEKVKFSVGPDMYLLRMLVPLKGSAAVIGSAKHYLASHCVEEQELSEGVLRARVAAAADEIIIYSRACPHGAAAGTKQCRITAVGNGYYRVDIPRDARDDSDKTVEVLIRLSE